MLGTGENPGLQKQFSRVQVRTPNRKRCLGNIYIYISLICVDVNVDVDVDVVMLMLMVLSGLLCSTPKARYPYNCGVTAPL